MNFRYVFKHLFTEPKWFFRYGLWQWLAPRNLYRYYVKYPYQRLVRGFDDTELWSLDYTIAKFALPRLREFAKNPSGCPCFSNDWSPEIAEADYKKWKAMLALMIEAMEYTIQDGEGELGPDNIEEMKMRWKRQRVGMRLFGKYFNALWD